MGFQAKIQELYAAHRVRRNAQQRDKFLAPDYKELIIDPYLLRLENPQIEPGFGEYENTLVRLRESCLSGQLWPQWINANVLVVCDDLPYSYNITYFSIYI